MTAYYNEIDPFAAEWLENLILVGAIAPGEVDRRSIEDVAPSDLKGFTQCHFFAGIGVWSYALRQAGWCDDRPVWTGSCPCQPFSAAGKGTGFDDERHIWPAFHHPITFNAPPVVFGEQVSSADGLAWLDLVQSDMEATAYAFGALDLCAAGVGAPHIRQRTFWMADASLQQPKQLTREGPRRTEGRAGAGDGQVARGGKSRVVDDSHDARFQGYAGDDGGSIGQWEGTQRPVAAPSVSGPLEHADGRPIPVPFGEPQGRNGERPDSPDIDGSAGRPGPTNGHWGNVDWLACRDGKWRPVEPGTFPLAHGVANRVGALRGYGNSIVSQVAEEFIKVAMEWLDQ